VIGQGRRRGRTVLEERVEDPASGVERFPTVDGGAARGRTLTGTVDRDFHNGIVA
jgi:hypothetical protein